MQRLRSAKALLLDADNNVLVLRRSESHPTQALKLDLPGGLIEVGENRASGLVREIFEETQLVVDPKSLRRVDITRYPFTVIIRALYIIKLTQSQPSIKISWEHDLYEWVSIESITTLELAVQKQVDKVIKKGLHKKY